MPKMNMGAVAQKIGGITVGVVAGGVIQKYLDGTSLPPIYGPLAMIAAGVFAPNLGGGKSGGFMTNAGDALIAKGVNKLVQTNFPTFIAGPDDEEVSGYGDDSVSGYPTADEVIVSGPGSDDESVAGLSGFVN